MTVAPLEQRQRGARMVEPSAGFAPDDPIAHHESRRGEMRREAVRPGLRRMRRARLKSQHDVDLKVIPGASAFATDPALSGPIPVIREYRSHQFARDAWDLSQIVFDDGANRMEGDWLSVALFRTDCGQPRLKKWYDDWASICFPLCGFKRIPSYNTVWLRFAELEANLSGLRWLISHLVRNALDHEPSLFDFVFYDGTPFRSWHRPKHGCLDEDACREAPRRPLAALKTAPLRELLEAKARAIEADVSDEPEDQPDGRNRRRLVPLLDANGEIERLVAVWTIDGHDYPTYDLTSGFRRYGEKSWFGGQLIDLVSPVVRLAGVRETLPAHLQEYEPIFTMLDELHEIAGAYPYAISRDRGGSFPIVTLGLTHRGVADVSPRRWTQGEPNRDPLERRRALWDEDGVPRCGFCDGEATYDLPGLGLFFTGRSDGTETPWLRFRCLIPQEEGCESLQKIDCTLAPTVLVPWMRTGARYNDLRTLHHELEAGFDVSRDKYAVAGKDSTCMPRAGVNVQLFHALCAQALDWFKVNLRHGWLTANKIDVKLNDHVLRSLATQQDRLTGEVKREGIGFARLERRVAARRANDTDLPYECD